MPVKSVVTCGVLEHVSCLCIKLMLLRLVTEEECGDACQAPTKLNYKCVRNHRYCHFGPMRTLKLVWWILNEDCRMPMGILQSSSVTKRSSMSYIDLRQTSTKSVVSVLLLFLNCMQREISESNFEQAFQVFNIKVWCLRCQG